MLLTPLVLRPSTGISSVLYLSAYPSFVIHNTSSLFILLTDINSSFSFNFIMLIGFVYLLTSNDDNSILLTIPSRVNAVTYELSNLFTAILFTIFSPSDILIILDT